MTTTPIEVRLLRDNEKELANAFFNRIYKSTRSTRDFLWEFFSAPAGKAIYVVAVENSDATNVKIVGIQCAIPIELVSSKGEIVLTAKSEDTLVDPSYRGQKIFERMYELLFSECKKAGIESIWGFTPAEKAFVRIGFSIPFKSKQALAVFDVNKAYTYLSGLNKENKTKDKLKIFGLCIMSWMRAKASSRRGGRRYQLTTSDFASLNDHFQSFYRATSMYNLNLSVPFVKWRIQDNPNKNLYEHYTVSYEGSVVASVVVNYRSEVSYIEQILVKDDAHFKPALALVVNRMRSEKAGLIRILCFENNAALSTQYAHLPATGFTTLDRGNTFVWKELGDGKASPSGLFLSRLYTQGNV